MGVRSAEMNEPSPVTARGFWSAPTDTRSTDQSIFRKVMLLQDCMVQHIDLLWQT